MHNKSHTSQCRDTLSQLFVVTTLMTEDMERGLAERGLTLTRAQVLWILGEETQMTQRELATRLKVTPRNVTALIDALEGTGFVRRTSHPTDRRATLVMLTRKGQASYSMLRSEMTQFAKLLFGHLSDSQLAQLTSVLEGVGATLTALAGEAPR